MNLLPHSSIYEVMVAAFRLYDERAKREGALQMVPVPASKEQKLRVCGDTHGQLADVLWIFDEHGEPSADNAYLFNGDVADRGKHAVEIFLLLLLYQLADPKCMFINRGKYDPAVDFEMGQGCDFLTVGFETEQGYDWPIVTADFAV